ncbi:MAG: hypothetical protein AAFY59_06765 [Pseudomonadota bacterium]
MGYRDDFYCPQNIIGWTGDLYGEPTVYFRRVLRGDLVEFGRITQAHQRQNNVGRGRVRNSCGYQIDNEQYANKLRAVERVHGHVDHFSRDIFLPLIMVPTGAEGFLHAAITRFTEKKTIHDDRIAALRENIAHHGQPRPAPKKRRARWFRFSL